MIMVYLIGVGAVLSIYFLFKNKENIGFELLRYYTYADEYLTRIYKSEDTKILSLYKDNLKLTEINVVATTQPTFFITKDVLVTNTEESYITKTFHTIYFYNNNNNNNNIKLDESQTTSDTNNNVIQTISYKALTNSIELSEPENSNILETELTELIFNNQQYLFHHYMKWDPSILATSITIIDEEGIYNFEEYDMTDFINSIARPGHYLILDNTTQNKQLWTCIFNYIFKSKNVYIPLSKIATLKLEWTVIFTNCNILTGDTIKIDFK